MQATEHRAGSPDGQFVDEIRIITVPRYKTSGLSGDEWRISARIEFYRKGHLVGTQTARNVEYAARFLDWHLNHGRETGDIDVPNELGRHCDQEGCSNEWVVRRKLKQRYGQDGNVLPRSWLGDAIEYRAFCAEHAERGDCGLDDADQNYEPME